VYYFNAVTNQSSWSKPAGFAGGATDAKPTSQMRVPGTEWFEVHCADGRKYYYNDRAEVIPQPFASTSRSATVLMVARERPQIYPPDLHQGGSVALELVLRPIVGGYHDAIR